MEVRGVDVRVDLVGGTVEEVLDVPVPCRGHGTARPVTTAWPSAAPAGRVAAERSELQHPRQRDSLGSLATALRRASPARDRDLRRRDRRWQRDPAGALSRRPLRADDAVRRSRLRLVVSARCRRLRHVALQRDSRQRDHRRRRARQRDVRAGGVHRSEGPSGHGAARRRDLRTRWRRAVASQQSGEHAPGSWC